MIIFDLINIIFDIIDNILKYGPDSILLTSITLFIISGSKLLSMDVVILEIRNCDGSLTDISLITSAASDRNGVSEVRVTSYSSICFDS